MIKNKAVTNFFLKILKTDYKYFKFLNKLLFYKT